MPAVMALLVSLSYTIIAGCEPALASRPEFVAAVAVVAIILLAWQQTRLNRSRT